MDKVVSDNSCQVGHATPVENTSLLQQAGRGEHFLLNRFSKQGGRREENAVREAVQPGI